MRPETYTLSGRIHLKHAVLNSLLAGTSTVYFQCPFQVVTRVGTICDQDQAQCGPGSGLTPAYD